MSARPPRLRLRYLHRGDAALLFRWRNAPAVRRASVNDRELVMDEHLVWFADEVSRPTTLIVQWDGNPVGWVRVEQWDPVSRTAGWGMALGEPATPGLGGSLPLLALGHGFDRLGVTELRGIVLADNDRMRSVMRRLALAPTGEDVITRPSGEPLPIIRYLVTAQQWPGIRDNALKLLPSSLRGEVQSALADEPDHGGGGAGGAQSVEQREG